jgi:hypothetical protein
VRVGEMRSAHKIILYTLKEACHLEDLGVDGWITLKRILRNRDGRKWIGCMWFRLDTGGGLLWTR